MSETAHHPTPTGYPAPLIGKTALIAVDLQEGILGWVPDTVRRQLVETNARLIDAFHAAGLPVVFIHATGLPAGRVANPIPEPEELPENFAELDGRLPTQASDLHVYKQRSISAFYNTELEEHLKAAGVQTVVLTGLATGMGVVSAARGAYDAGFNVTVATDAVFDGFEERHRAVLEVILPSIAVLLSSGDVLSALEG